MAHLRLPSDEERVAFVRRLTQFREELAANEQRMLDALVAAGRQAHAEGETDVYWLPGTWARVDGGSDLWTAFNGPSTISDTPQEDLSG